MKGLYEVIVSKLVVNFPLLVDLCTVLMSKGYCIAVLYLDQVESVAPSTVLPAAQLTGMKKYGLIVGYSATQYIILFVVRPTSLNITKMLKIYLGIHLSHPKLRSCQYLLH